MKKNLSWTSICLMVVVVPFSLIVFNGCGGRGSSNSSDCAAPALDASGTWCITITGGSGACGPSDTTPYDAEFSQSGNDVSVTANGGTYTGKICGNKVTMTGLNWGFNTTTHFTFSDARHGSGSTTYSNGTCSGTDTVTAVKGPCL